MRAIQHSGTILAGDGLPKSNKLGLLKLYLRWESGAKFPQTLFSERVKPSVCKHNQETRSFCFVYRYLATPTS